MTRRYRGSITRDRDKWRVRVWIDGIRETLGSYDTRERAEAVLAAWLEQHQDKPGGLTLGGWGQRWLDERERDGRHRGLARERDRWRAHVADAPIADKLLTKLRRADVVRWVKETARKEAVHVHYAGGERVERGLGRRVSRRTVGRALGLLRACLSDAVGDGYIETNPALGVPLPKDDAAEQAQSEIVFLTADEVQAVITSDAIPESARLIYTVAIFTGLRPGELWGLRWCDVRLDGDRPHLEVRRSRNGPPKGKRTREVPLLPPARAALRRWRELSPGIGTALVWPAEGGRCHADGYDAGWSGSYRPDGTQRDGHRELAGVRRGVTFKDLRHTCGSHLVSGTWGRVWALHEVRDWLGHRSVTTTETYYARLVPGHLHVAARAMEDALGTQGDPGGKAK